jgi:hypothetical protein
LAKEEQARFAEGLSGIVSPDLTLSPGRTRIKSEDFQSYFPAGSPMPFVPPRKRFGSADSNMMSPISTHSCLFRAFSIATFDGKMERADGFPYLSFSPGQVFPLLRYADQQEFEVTVEKGDRWLARVHGTDEIGWIPKSHCIQILM